MADGFDGSVVHLDNHDAACTAVCRAPIADLVAHGRRMGWTFGWASSLGSDFDHDVGVSSTDEQLPQGAEYDLRALLPVPDPAGWPHDLPGISAFTGQDGVVHHTYSAYARGGDALDDVPVARPGAARPQRDARLVHAARRVLTRAPPRARGRPV